MPSHRFRLTIPSSVELAGDAENFARRVAATLMKGMDGTFGAIGREGDRIVWTAHEWQEDGTFVTLSIDPVERSIELYVDTRGLERPSPSTARWTWPLICMILVVGIAAGVWRGSVLLSVVVLIVGFGCWIGVDVGRQIATERRRRIDADWWDGHLKACIDEASSA